ncbi:hypothetical protein LJC23_04275 [Desulfovibrio sp. OttesenSCG-928-I05]|nr:hypothetical protein [Desulfovibrio sp. OttesenSCG-928-I05]
MHGTITVTNFTAGEWSPKLYGRIDLGKYSQACAELVNMTLIPHGAVTRRMGTEFVGFARSDELRLVGFIFNTEQAYVLEFTPGSLRFFRDGGLIEAATLETPYSWDDIQTLDFCQSADVMYLVCPNHTPKKLTRPGADSFTLADVKFTGKPAEWTEGNWPGTVTFHQQRLWMAGAPKQPQKVWASKTSDFENFTTGTSDTNGMVFSLVSEQVNAVRWMLSQKRLLAGTSGGEWILGTSGDTAVTPGNLQATRNSNYGSAAIRPLLIGASGVHVSDDMRRLRSLAYSFGDDSFLSQDISLLAEHLTRSSIRAVAYCQNPDGVIWCVTRAGELIGCTYLKEQEVIAWHRHETQGEVLSLTCVPGENYTETWLAVRRRNGVTIERMAPPWDGKSSNEAGCWFLDCALLYDADAAPEQGEHAQKLASGVIPGLVPELVPEQANAVAGRHSRGGSGAVVSLSGLDHLEGQTVSILADGAAHPDRVVKGGRISLAVPARRVLVGLASTWRLSPMNLEGLSPSGTTQGKRARITEVMARLYKTLGLSYAWAGQTEEPFELPMREVDMPMDAAPVPYTGDVTLPMPSGWGRDSRVILSGRGAFPATIVMLAVRAVVNE